MKMPKNRTEITCETEKTDDPNIIRVTCVLEERDENLAKRVTGNVVAQIDKQDGTIQYLKKKASAEDENKVRKKIEGLVEDIVKQAWK